MTEEILVQIVGAPVACADGVVDAWRKTTTYVADKLNARFGAAVRVSISTYSILFARRCRLTRSFRWCSSTARC